MLRPPPPPKTNQYADSTEPAKIVYEKLKDVLKSCHFAGISDTESQNVNGDAVDGGVSENEPVVLPDVIRESDRHDEEELPETGTTRSLLAQWRNMEQTVQNQGVSSTRPSQTQVSDPQLEQHRQVGTSAHRE